MGGDKGPGVIIAGLLRAVHQHSNIRFLVHGPEDVLKPLIDKHNLEEFCTIVHAERTVSMDDKPSQVMRHGKGTSMWSACDLGQTTRGRCLCLLRQYRRVDGHFDGPVAQIGRN
jgi:glycerol-3-phosphate acyltransferase PlsX